MHLLANSFFLNFPLNKSYKIKNYVHVIYKIQFSTVLTLKQRGLIRCVQKKRKRDTIVKCSCKKYVVHSSFPSDFFIFPLISINKKILSLAMVVMNRPVCSPLSTSLSRFVCFSLFPANVSDERTSERTTSSPTSETDRVRKSDVRFDRSRGKQRVRKLYRYYVCRYQSTFLIFSATWHVVSYIGSERLLVTFIRNIV